MDGGPSFDPLLAGLAGLTFLVIVRTSSSGVGRLEVGSDGTEAGAFESEEISGLCGCVCFDRTVGLC